MVAEDRIVEDLVKAIQFYHVQLTQLPSLHPAVEVDQAFTKLVGLCSQIVSARVVAKVSSRMPLCFVSIVPH